MNGGCVPMLGTRPARSSLQNGGVKKPLRLPLLSPARTRVVAARRDCGFTLIEVMVALIVLVLGVLGASAMTLAAIRDSKQSALRSQASALAYELADLIRMTPEATQLAVYTGAPPSSVSSCWTTGCSLDDMARNNYFEWRAKLTGANGSLVGLPNGDARICRDAANLASDAASYATCDNLPTSPLVVKLRWDEKENNARGAASTNFAARTYLVVPILPN